MPGLVPGIHVLLPCLGPKTWRAGTSPAMTRVIYTLKIVSPRISSTRKITTKT